MKIVIDNIIFGLQKSGGISVVWFELLKRLLKENNISVEFVEPKSNKNTLHEKLEIKKSNIIKLESNIFIKRYISPNIEKNDPFIFHSTYYRTSTNKKSINITTVHDFTYEYFSKGMKKKIHTSQKFKAIRNSQHVICISENTKKDLLNFIPDINMKNISVIPNGVSNDFYLLNEIEPLDNQNTLNKNEYVLYIGSRAKYKNFDLVLNSISDSKYKLVVVGSPFSTYEIDLIKKLNISNKIIFLGNVSNKILNSLYNYAFALIYPSSYEGFGIPVLEAQSAGCPVIAYNKSSIPEVIGDKTLLIEELNSISILNKLEMLEDIDLRVKVIENGLKNSEKYSWDNTFDKVLALYKEIWGDTF